jgi:uncharacterized protein (TIGR02599 family)
MIRRDIPRNAEGFTLLELLVAASILILLLGLAFSVISQSSAIWSRSMDKIESFRGARLGFETITRNLSQATLNTYLDYDDPANPQNYLKKSELKFFVGTAGSGTLPGTANTGGVIFFQAPLGYTSDAAYAGIESLLNTCGYFVSFTTNSSIPSHVASSKSTYRYRLMQLLVPAEKNQIYTSSDWFTPQSNTSYAKPIVDNVIALIVRPQDPAALATELPNSQYTYDTTLNATTTPQPVTANQLPPMVQVTMVAIDETSAKRIDNGSTPPAVITAALQNKFSDPAQYQADLDSLSLGLSAHHINYRIFSSAVPLRESKWMK